MDQPTTRALPALAGSTAAVAPEVDRALTAAAMAARAGDREARDALHAALAEKIGRFVARYRHGWGDGAWDADDVAQEAYLVLVELIDGWPGGESFVAYFLSRFPWRLRDAVRRLAGPRPVSAPPDDSALTLVVDGSAAAETARALLGTLAADLPEPDRTILWRHIGEGERFGVIATSLHLDRRTVNRRWQALVAELRDSLAPVPQPPSEPGDAPPTRRPATARRSAPSPAPVPAREREAVSGPVRVR
ncbi:MAG: hypothetical protein AVDCRST_MAG49-2875 [uncultured Thermomicrobiales bacterium]|uniref:RNA polymerase sigma-70 region 2 domain-containing protein n=1 Tax=uncultured Thermomicrobiales bacterium TaxID=1645740 RepID=A0A6J4UR69_9BACT|nr:MAG: hypothetical protein AVDCRST_MAG49-2875 [uncultured Thermomicrobiales bacterium]